MISTPWYRLENTSEADSPSLVIYKERIQQNISKMIEIAGDAKRLYTHIKTNKMPEVVKMMLEAGISKFKCATIAEAEMAAPGNGLADPTATPRDNRDLIF